MPIADGELKTIETRESMAAWIVRAVYLARDVTTGARPALAESIKIKLSLHGGYSESLRNQATQPQRYQR